MGWYDGDCDRMMPAPPPVDDIDEDYDPDCDPDAEWDVYPGSGPPTSPVRSEWYASPHEVELRFYRPPRIIRCQAGGGSGCDEQAEVSGGFAMTAVYDQIRWWQRGWRRDPATALDYCPVHAPGGLR